MKRVLLAGFDGAQNAAKVLLDECTGDFEKLCLVNDFDVCAAQMERAVEAGYDFILVLGQKPGVKSLYIETMGRGLADCYETVFDYSGLGNALKVAGYAVRISQNAGNYLCNHVYYHGLRAAKERTQILFLHVPYLKNMPAPTRIAAVLSAFLQGLKTHT